MHSSSKAAALVLVAMATLSRRVQAEPASTTFCDVLKDPSRHHGQLVTFEADVVSGVEVFGLLSPGDESSSDCGLIWLSYPEGSPAAHLTISAQDLRLERPIVTLRRDGPFRRLQRLLATTVYPREEGSMCISCSRYRMTVRVTGRVDVAPQGSGFGHLNAHRVQLVLQRVQDVRARDLLGSVYDPAKYSGRPVRFPSGEIRGRVIDDHGRPLAGIKVDVRAVDEATPLYKALFWPDTDEQGRFRVVVPVGTYTVGVNTGAPPSAAVPYSATYLPGAGARNKARRIAVTDHQKIKGLTIRLADRLPERVIEVKVVWPDGSPVAQANVWLADTRWPETVVGGPVSHTDSGGNVRLTGLQGPDYVVRADIYVKPRFFPHCAEARQVHAPDQDPIVMPLTRSGESCRTP